MGRAQGRRHEVGRGGKGSVKIVDIHDKRLKLSNGFWELACVRRFNIQAVKLKYGKSKFVR